MARPRRWRDTGRRGSGGRGSVSVELAILAPVFLGLILAAIVVGRTETAYNALTIAAHDAARAASISHTAQDAAHRAETVAHTTLAQQQLACERVDVVVDTSQFARPVGDPAVVRVSITCRLTFGDLGLGLTRELAVTFASPVDTWRDRSLGFNNSEASSAANRSGGVA